MHVTLRVAPHVYGLRSHRCFRAVRSAFVGGCNRFGMRLVHYSVQGNHLHLICEASDERALGRAMQGLGVRLARALNRVMGRKGQVFPDRFHSRALRTPLAVRRVLAYVLNNARRHGLLRASGVDVYSSAGAFDGWNTPLDESTRWALVRLRLAVSREQPVRRAVVRPKSWLLRVGWRAHGLIDPSETPGPRPAP